MKSILKFFFYFISLKLILISSTIMKKEYVQDKYALCLDGTLSSYYIHYSSSNSNQFIFYVEDGGANCVLSEKICYDLIDTVPYFTTSNETYHPNERNATTILSNDPKVGPWPNANFIYMNYCSQDGWLGLVDTPIYSRQLYLRGSYIFQAIILQVLKNRNINNTQLVLVGSSAGTIGVFNHIDWIINTLGFSVHNVQMVLDSFYAPVTQVTPIKDLVINLPLITYYSPQSMTYWVDGFPCAVVFECMVSTGYIPSGIKTLIISSSWDAIVFAYGTSGAANVDPGSTTEDLVKFVAEYIAFSGSVVESAVNMYYRKEFSNTTVFIAGCIHHLYIMPFDPVYRLLQVSDNEKQIAEKIKNSDGMWSDSATFGSLAVLKGSGGPFRWDTVNFAGSRDYTGSRMNPPQYPTPATLGEMVRIWSKSNIPDIAGDLCATSPQCGDYCNHEEISAFEIPVRNKLYQSLNAFSALIFLVVVFTLVYVVNTDHVHHISLSTSYKMDQESHDHNLTDIYLAQKKAQNEIEEIEKNQTLDDDDENNEDQDDEFSKYIAPLGLAKSPRASPRAVQRGMRRSSSRARISRGNIRDSYNDEEKVHSARLAVANIVGAGSGRLDYDTGKAQNLKMMALLKTWMVNGQDAILWHGVTYKADINDKSPILNKIWGALRYGKVTAIMGPSGCGKSTLLKVLGGQVKSGYFEGTYQKHILLRGFEIVSEKQGAIGFVRQHGAGTVIPSLTVYENLYYRTCLFASKRDTFDDIHKTCTSLLNRCGLEHRKNVKVTSLSGGQQKRLAIGMEILANDSVIFMDEPTSGLDASSSLEVMTLIKNEALLHGKCVALVIHQPRNEIFYLLDDLLLLKEGRTLYYGSVAWFRENIVPQLASSAFDSIGDRIIDHITTYNDLYVPNEYGVEHDDSNIFRSETLKHEFLISTSSHSGLRRVESNINSSVTPTKYDKLSSVIDQFYQNLMNEEMTSFLDDGIPGNAFMIDARFKPNANDLLNKLNSILSMYGNDEKPIYLQYQESKQLNFYYKFTKYFFKVFVNIRRLFLTFNTSAIIFNILLALSLYPIMALLLLHGLKANDLFLGICFLVFFPFMFVTVSCAASMADVYRLLIIDVEDGIYSSLSLQCSFMIYFIFSALIICITALGSIFVIRPMTGWIELYEALMLLNLDMLFFLGMIYFCVVANAGDPGLVFRNVTILLTFCTLFGGLLINIYKFPNFIKWVLQMNPLFISAATNQYLFIDSCTLIYGNHNFCRSFMMTAFGYYPYSEPGLGNGIILCWGIFFNIISWIILILKQSTKGVYISERQDDNTFTKILTSVSTASLNSAPSNRNIDSRTSLKLTQPIPSSGEKSMSKISSLPRMIQQKSTTRDFDDNSSVASYSSTNNDSDKNSKKYNNNNNNNNNNDTNNNNTKIIIRKSNSMPEQYSSIPQYDNKNNNNNNLNLIQQQQQYHKVHSMLTSLPRTDEEYDEVLDELHNWEQNAGILDKNQKSLHPVESNPRLHALDKIRKNSITNSNNSSNSSLVELEQNSHPRNKHKHAFDDDLDDFLNQNVIQVEDEIDEEDENTDEIEAKYEKLKKKKSHNHTHNHTHHKNHHKQISNNISRPPQLQIDLSDEDVNNKTNNHHKKKELNHQVSSNSSISSQSTREEKKSNNSLINPNKHLQKIHSKRHFDSFEVNSNEKKKTSVNIMKHENEVISF